MPLKCLFSTYTTAVTHNRNGEKLISVEQMLLLSPFPSCLKKLHLVYGSCYMCQCTVIGRIIRNKIIKETYNIRLYMLSKVMKIF